MSIYAAEGSAPWCWEADLHRLDVLAPDDVDLERDGRHLGATSLQQPGSMEQSCVWQTKTEKMVMTASD